ncbi:unnamed protein product [Rhizophagus irregularis]|nr:unnamed protein product [Rhizophagus irregularis]
MDIYDIYIPKLYAYSWLDTLKEPWARKLIADFVMPFRANGTIIPFGTAGIMVQPPFCRPVLMITVWDVVCLLWTHYIMGMSFLEEMSYRNKKKYLSRMLINLTDKMEMMEENALGRPTTLNLNAFGGKKEDCTIYVRSVNPQRNSNTEIGETDVIFQQQVNSGVKSGSYTSIIECCPNQERTQTLQSSMGQLLRIGTLAGTTWTKEIPKTPCHLVVPNVQSRGANIPETMSPVPAGGKQDEVRGCRNSSTNPLMIVEYDRK